MISVTSAKCLGIEAIPVNVEVNISTGIGIHLIGLADAAVKESLLRTVTALQFIGFRIPGKKIVINLAPADIRKNGSGYDVPIALGIMAASGQTGMPGLGKYVIMGELGLDASVKRIPGALPVVEFASAAGYKGCILPEESAMEACEYPDTDIYGVRTLEDVLKIVCEKDDCSDMLVKHRARTMDGRGRRSERAGIMDFSEIIGQSAAKRGLEIAAAGGSVSFTYSTTGQEPVITIPETDNWLSCTVADGTVTLSAEANLSGADRSTEVSVAAGWKTMSLSVSQARVPLLEQTEFEFSRDAVSQTVSTTEYVSADMEWSVLANDEWITAEKTPEGISFSFGENTTGELRTGTISMLDADNNVMETVTVSQRIYSYSFFLGTWILTYVPKGSEQTATDIVILEEDEAGTGYVLTGNEVIYMSANLTYDDAEGTMFWGAQYVGNFGTNGYIWWCPYTTNGYYTWDTAAGLTLVYNMDETDQTLTFEQMYLNSESGSTCGFYMLGFDTQDPTDRTETPSLYDAMSLLVSMTRVSAPAGE